ncbi:hypothetical protein [Nocardia sp. XZ_19_369]|uniref:hypothetical protein n=1 Tax=Nocardia sp. XZ_19_369 TaxID=2769487 RepID=UPI001890B599|nr:hypothetical protein [Nocardia sp. XZ_19_369]
MISDPLEEHPASFAFDFAYWFDCECGQRVEVSAAAYDRQCQGDEPYPRCECGATIVISEVHPTLRDLSDVDCQDDQVDNHWWYHSSSYEDWPSPRYRGDIAAQLKQSLLPAHEHAEAIKAKSSLALHLGTYAAAVENMFRRMKNQDSPAHQYWLHQVQIRLRPTDLEVGIHPEMAGWFGDVPISALTARGARAVRYVNTHEAPGSISLAIDPHVIVRLRTIPLSTAPVLPSTVEGDRAVDVAVTDLAAAQQLCPDTTHFPEGQVFESWLDIMRAEIRGITVTDQVKQLTERLTPQFELYRSRQHEIWSELRTALTDIYLAGVTPQTRDRLLALEPAALEPEQYHRWLRERAGVIAQPHAVVAQFASVPWRTVDPAGWSSGSDTF